MLTELIDKIGPAKLKRMLDKALVACQQDYEVLQKLLEQQDWEQAAKQAHPLKSTARLLGCYKFIHSLEIVEQGNLPLINQLSFRRQLECEYLDCLDTIQQLLNSSSS